MINIGKELKYDKNVLKKSFDEAKKNEQFNSFLSKIKLDDEILMKYTSSLEESFEEYSNCLECKGLSECKNKMLGHAYLPKTVNKIITFSYKPCKYKVNQDKKYNHLKNVKYFDLPSNYKDASWDKVDKRLASRKEVLSKMIDFINNPSSKGIYLSGNFGCGKTFIIVSAFNELAKKNIKSAVVFWPEFLRNLKSSFDTDYEDKFDYIKRVPILLIDDLGAEATTSWSRDEILCPILQHRMDNNLATFITSNLNIDNLEKHLAQTKEGIEAIKAKRIIERIKYLTEEFEMVSKNMRN